ncbi:ABC transporter ATP-binding protein/permease [Taylorella equigenitalis]|uniref:ABC transporter ATP-binding protein/permease n=1 Tax=Taylorella equigenitalis TaxID=29575 RepID=UPI0004204CDD|nr:ABC transporter ATP-binding protein/permease [Taylorella equigenitalis]ASY37768.1 ABC transporter ATP-binding protein [Taylorella equigenitalis]ASY42189.1 ABC transporter ATP-binding protein [Taylorella equigenitalis]KGK32787.1 ABC transporter ATP-binding protein [Taylorella equigenitalis]RBA26169.1 ABC transporter ATP-binding protein/permease [Taylorella equigenitalis]WDU50048.1 ABC transporter ATP-binding protein/permease [Taylorella equigenitalis]
MNWSKELLDSAIWIAKSYVFCIVFLAIVGAIIVKTTTWGRQFWFLARKFFDPKVTNYKYKYYPIIGFAVILLIDLMGVRLGVLFSYWYKNMYDALQKVDENIFWVQMVVFSILAGIHIFRALLAYYLNNRFKIRWRENLNDDLLSKWLNKRSYLRSYYLNEPIDNPDQRIQQDIQSFVGYATDLTLGLLTSVISIIAYTAILWNLSGPIEFHSFTIPKAMVFIIFLYVILTTVLAFKIGHPLIKLNFISEKVNANYRYSLIRIREYAESIAFYAGEKLELSKLKNKFEQVIKIFWDIIFRNLKFQGFNLIVSQASVVIPFIIQAPRFFSGKILLGDMIQTSQSFSALSGSLSFFRESYDTYAAFKAVLDRLTGFYENINKAEKLPEPNLVYDDQKLKLQNVDIYTPSNKLLVKDLNFEVNNGEAYLIQGASGSGKTTLFRCISGLWPYSSGQITVPKDGVLFLSQKPYLPEGSLIDTFFYPNPSKDSDNSMMDEILDMVALPHLKGRLNEVANWSHTLSLGEQQRIALARILINKPKVIFLDEATSAMDEGLEFNMYKMIIEKMSDSKIISVGHRSTLVQHHTHLLTLLGDGNWSLKELNRTV